VTVIWYFPILYLSNNLNKIKIKIKNNLAILLSHDTQALTLVTNEIKIEVTRVQPSTSVSNNLISKVVNTQILILVSSNVIVKATNA